MVGKYGEKIYNIFKKNGIFQSQHYSQGLQTNKEFLRKEKSTGGEIYGGSLRPLY